jgi:peptidoglycan-N-acetylglucosamine deacetylase
MRRRTLAGAAVLGGGFAYFNAQYPTSQLYGRTIAHAPGAGNRIAITYDDGPNPIYTPQLLELYERHGAKATFFEIGKWIEREPALAREVQAAGHALGNHTYTHPTLALCSSDRVKEELRRCRALGVALRACGAAPGHCTPPPRRATSPCSGRSRAGTGAPARTGTTSRGEA